LIHKIVLVRSKYPRNIGMSARAMTNFGVNELILIDPQCELNEEAREGAARGQFPLQNCKIYNDWASFIESEKHLLRVAFTRREGQRRPVKSLPAIGEWIQGLKPPGCAFIFGPEDHGLSQQDLEYVHRLCSFDIPGEQKSMNLSHAVLFFLSQWWMNYHSSKTLETQEASQAFPDLDRLDPHFQQILGNLGFDLSRPRWNMLIAVKQLLKKAAPNEAEMKMIENLAFQGLRKMRNPNKDFNKKNFPPEDASENSRRS